MSGSSIRTTWLKKLQEILDEPDLTIKKPHSIRWLGLRNVVLAVYKSYGALLATLSSFAAEGNPQAEGLLKYFSQYDSYISMIRTTWCSWSSCYIEQSATEEEFCILVSINHWQMLNLSSWGGGGNERAAVNATRKCIEIRVEDDKSHAYLSGEKLSHYSENTEMHAVIYLQFYTYASQDSLGLYNVSPIENHCVHYRIFHYNFVSPGTRWDLKCESQSKNVSTGLGMRR